MPHVLLMHRIQRCLLQRKRVLDESRTSSVIGGSSLFEESGAKDGDWPTWTELREELGGDRSGEVSITANDFGSHLVRELSR